MPDAALLPALPACGYWLPILIPGDVDALAIRRDYDTAMRGLTAFVRMGFRIRDVKLRLPHGAFMKWCKEWLPGLSHRHLHRSRQIAEMLVALAGFKLDTRVQFDELPPSLVEIVNGSPGIRHLMTGLAEFRHDPTEESAKAWCEERWEADPELRDEFEPSVLAGERSYVQAKIAMLGVSQRGGSRADSDYLALARRNARSLSGLWSHWDKIPKEHETELMEEYSKAFEEAPSTILEIAIAAHARKFAKEGRRRS